ncbi:MAG: DsbA family protein [Candidatus Omnitrophica bacterium]|nr:DsbA family protein [Candidatus Omnitrophota bacterium]
MNKKLLTVGVIIVAIATVAGVKLYLNSRSVNTVTGRTKGNPQAPVKIVEFIDFQCPACAAGAKMLNARLKQYPDKIHLEMKYFPLKMHAHAFLSSRFAECAARQDKFWAYHDKLIYGQNEWSKVVNAYPLFLQMAQEAGLDTNQLHSCLNDAKIDKVINEHHTEGRKLGVRSTPTYFVNGEIVVGTRDLEKKIKELLEEGEGQGGQH